MRNLISTLTLAGMLTVATLSEAGPRKPVPSQVPQTLSGIEEVCYIVGDTANTSARMRDTGLSYLEAVQLMRQVIAKNPMSGEWGEWFTTSILGNLRWVYEHPSTPVQQIRNDTELACLRIAEQNGLLSTTTSTDRH
jgi:hypothetical protein